VTSCYEYVIVTGSTVRREFLYELTAYKMLPVFCAKDGCSRFFQNLGNHLKFRCVIIYKTSFSDSW